MIENKLSPDDQEKVDRYLASSVHQVERRAFRPWRLLAMLAGFLIVLSGISYLIAVNHGIA